MSIHAWMLTGLLLGASPAADPAPVPKLDKGIELTWRGQFSEAVLRPNVRAFRNYDVEIRLFVLEMSDRGADVAIFTLIKLKPDVKMIPEPLPIVRLELARIESNSRTSLLTIDAFGLTAEKRKNYPMPLMAMEGLPLLEPNLFINLPGGEIRLGQRWEIPEESRPGLKYRLEGFDSVRGSRALKFQATQQTEDWDLPRSERTAWRRTESTWVSLKQGYAGRIERTIEKRDPDSGDVGFRSKFVLEQVGNLRYPDRFGEDRRLEILAAARFVSQYERLLPDAGASGPQPFEKLVEQIGQHIRGHLAGDSVPYREATLFVKRKAEAAKSGNSPPVPLPPETSEPNRALVGRPLADVAMVDLVRNESVRLATLRGRVSLLVYYQPSSQRTAEPVLRLADKLHTQLHGKLAVVPLAIGQSETAVKQRTDFKLSVPIYAGLDVYKQHQIDSTPCFILIDERGLVRKLILGWSDENAAAVESEIAKWVK